MASSGDGYPMADRLGSLSRAEAAVGAHRLGFKFRLSPSSPAWPTEVF